jgi:hypothetical protein
MVYGLTDGIQMKEGRREQGVEPQSGTRQKRGRTWRAGEAEPMLNSG